MFNRLRYFIIFIILLCFLTSCGEDRNTKQKTFSSIKDVAISKWGQLSRKKIYFGHRSVGNNIIDGIKNLIGENPQIKLNITQPTDKIEKKNGFFMHSMIKQNASPKIIAIDYEQLQENLNGSSFDIVLIRFTPFYDETEMDGIFADYKQALNQLKNKYPNTIFIHGTYPLTRSKTTWKTWIKKIIGKKEIWEYDQNIKVNEFNNSLRKEYLGKDPFFDLARFQSTYPDGRRSTFTKEGKTYFHMVPDFTYDNVHLNENARRMIAERLLLYMISLI